MIFFLAGCCMAQRLRCPGGRPSVSYERVEDVAVTLDVNNQMKATAQKSKRHQLNHVAASQRVQGSGKGSLFLERSIKGSRVKAESTHVDRPKGRHRLCCEGRVGLHNLKNAHMILKNKRHSNALPGAIGFFFGWMLHGSTPLSGRSPFCQLRRGEDVAKSLDIKHQVKQQRKLEQTKNQTTMQPPRECKRRVKGGLFLGR